MRPRFTFSVTLATLLAGVFFLSAPVSAGFMDVFKKDEKSGAKKTAAKTAPRPAAARAATPAPAGPVKNREEINRYMAEVANERALFDAKLKKMPAESRAAAREEFEAKMARKQKDFESR